MASTKGTALVTGASTGIGAIYAERLAIRGYDIILVARNAAKLSLVADRLRNKTGRNLEVIAADLSNRAGVGATAPLLQSDADAMSAMITLNVEALMRLSYAAAPAFASRGSGTIINIASIVAIAPEVLNGVCGGSKAFVLAFSQSLRHELAASGVTVQVVLPGATATDFWEIAGTPVAHLPEQIVMRADALVDAALAGLDQGEFVTIPALADVGQWDAFEAARLAMADKLSTRQPAARYGLN